LRAPALWTDSATRVTGTLGPASDLRASDDLIEAALAWPMTVQQSSLRALGFDALRDALSRDHLPLPPAAARAHYFPDDDLAYWLFGYGDLLLLREHADLGGATILDFGCSSGRVLRHLHVHEPTAKLLGIDVNVAAVSWARAHLPFVIAQGTFIPTLPLPDASIDVAYAGSVFTHIDDTEEAWLLELRRVLRPDGVALVSFHPERSWAEMVDPAHPLRALVESTPHRMDPPGDVPVFDARPPANAERVVFTALDQPSSNANVVHSRAYVREHWGRLFKVEGFVDRAHGAHQDAVVLRHC
jgi:SAM-dependent methyltransferase